MVAAKTILLSTVRDLWSQSRLLLVPETNAGFLVSRILFKINFSHLAAVMWLVKVQLEFPTRKKTIHIEKRPQRFLFNMDRSNKATFNTI